jgi:hypothetical protein
MSAVPFAPATEPEDGAKLLNEVRDALSRYVVFPSIEALDAAVLWCAATHAQNAWEHAPRLAVTSPEKRCGKSRLMDVSAEICNRVIITVNASTAAVVRSITDQDPPTLMVDEADTIFGTKKAAENNEDMRGILNAGHQRNRPYIRWDVTSRSLEPCPTFAMAMLASIGDLPDTIMDRAIVVRMRRRGPGEKVAPFRTRRDAPALRDLRDRLHEWVRSNLVGLEAAVPDLPVEDRAADTWEPLFAIANLAGSEWPRRARLACLALTGEEPDEGRIGTRLLADLKLIWADDEEGLHTDTITDRLHKLEEAPWKGWGPRREEITARGLADLLKPYRVTSRNVRIGGVQKKGYYRADLLDPWQRYVRNPSQASQRPNDGETPSQPRDASETNDPSHMRPDTQGQPWDGNGTHRNSDIRPGSDKGVYMDWDGGTDGTAQVPTDDLCYGCGERLTWPDEQQRGTCSRCWRPTQTTEERTSA